MTVTPKINGIAPQFLVDDLDKAVAYYRDELGFRVDFVYESYYAAVSRGGASIHLKHAPKTISDRAHRKANEHLDAYIDVSNVDALFDDVSSRRGKVIKQLQDRPWQCRTSMSRISMAISSASARTQPNNGIEPTRHVSGW